MKKIASVLSHFKVHIFHESFHFGSQDHYLFSFSIRLTCLTSAVPKLSVHISNGIVIMMQDFK